MPACRPPRGDDRRDDEERQRGDAGRDQRDLGGTRLRVADGPVVISLPIDPLWRALTWRHNVLAESFGPTAVWFREAAFIRRKRPPLRLSLPISFGGFLPELLGQPRCDQRYSARRPVPGSGDLRRLERDRLPLPRRALVAVVRGDDCYPRQLGEFCIVCWRPQPDSWSGIVISPVGSLAHRRRSGGWHRDTSSRGRRGIRRRGGYRLHNRRAARPQPQSPMSPEAPPRGHAARPSCRATSPLAFRLARGRPEHTERRTDRTGFASDRLV